MDTVECGNTEDTILAKAITIATQSYQKILYFQIEAAAQDCLELLKETERMNDRYDFYHFIAFEIIFNNKSYEDVLKLIRDGHVHRLVDTTRAYDHLGDVVYVELPEVGISVSQGKNFGAVVNESPYERGWIIVVKISDSGELNSLMNDKNFSKFCKEEDGKYSLRP
ncbi:hypothetical protein E2562_016504 [Oryza meyeriana var. granulata]|uniref:Lipoyl-binding domain-containing protein n=1 Tax=Oryza meyeriana var. granulata TaxID=110450 RepID=A0A6G1C690_9ORYZ|nr:hypothetical protein E2562_016504 [Oryza meyeriana var. granulata]